MALRPRWRQTVELPLGAPGFRIVPSLTGLARQLASNPSQHAARPRTNDGRAKDRLSEVAFSSLRKREVSEEGAIELQGSCTCSACRCSSPSSMLTTMIANVGEPARIFGYCQK
jgi:hypothetical protein